MRHPSIVVQEIKDNTPIDNEFYKKIDWYIDDFSYKAPEVWRDCYFRFLNEILQPMIGKPLITEDWKIKILSIWTTKSTEEVIQMINEENNKK